LAASISSTASWAKASTLAPLKKEFKKVKDLA